VKLQLIKSRKSLRRYDGRFVRYLKRISAWELFSIRDIFEDIAVKRAGELKPFSALEVFFDNMFCSELKRLSAAVNEKQDEFALLFVLLFEDFMSSRIGEFERIYIENVPHYVPLPRN